MTTLILTLLMIVYGREAIELPRPPEPKTGCEIVIVSTVGPIVVCR